LPRDYKNAKKVNSINEEYTIVEKMKCDCGGTFKVIMQALVENENKYYDVLTGECLNCNAKKEFIFDINSFFGKW